MNETAGFTIFGCTVAICVTLAMCLGSCNWTLDTPSPESQKIHACEAVHGVVVVGEWNKMYKSCRLPGESK